MYTLVGTQIKGIGGGGQSPAEKEQHWAFLTQWSFPKLETARLIIPGLFGYRLQDYITDTNKDSAYWGRIGEDLHIDDLESSNPESRAAAAASLGVQPEIQTVMRGDNKAAREQIVDQIKGYMQRRHTGSGDYTGGAGLFAGCFWLAQFLAETSWPFHRNGKTGRLVLGCCGDHFTAGGVGALCVSLPIYCPSALHGQHSQRDQIPSPVECLPDRIIGLRPGGAPSVLCQRPRQSERQVNRAHQALVGECRRI